MASAIQEVIASIDALIVRAAAASSDAPTVEEINDMLSTGYLRALQADSERRHLERRIGTLSAANWPDAQDRRAAVIARRRTVAEATLLRARLDVLRGHFTRLRRAA